MLSINQLNEWFITPIRHVEIIISRIQDAKVCTVKSLKPELRQENIA